MTIGAPIQSGVTLRYPAPPSNPRAIRPASGELPLTSANDRFQGGEASPSQPAESYPAATRDPLRRIGRADALIRRTPFPSDKSFGEFVPSNPMR